MRTTLTSKRLTVSKGSVARHINAADAILVGHTHFDHALDIPEIVAQFDSTVYGSSSLVTLLGLYGLAANAVEVENHRTYAIGPFEITFVPSLHSKLVFGLKVPADGEFTCDNLDSLGQGAYRCGRVFGVHIAVAGTTIYHQGSANLIEDEIPYRDIDYFLCGLAGRIYTPHYVERILSVLRPKVVVPAHHDNFFKPLDAPMDFSFNVNLTSFVEDVDRFDSDIAVRTLRLLQTVAGQSSAGA